MKTLGRLDGFLGGHMAPVVLCCVALGIAFPEVLSHLNGVTVGLFAFMTFPTAWAAASGSWRRWSATLCRWR